mmetsp:Transcript_23168/g.48061  ORF Transcript_23168/g.48061 Transcript_23168/m.48061 type:complete len:86 (-) Transcript_23168:219-476(-)
MSSSVLPGVRASFREEEVLDSRVGRVKGRLMGRLAVYEAVCGRMRRKRKGKMGVFMVSMMDEYECIIVVLLMYYGQYELYNGAYN